MAETKFVKTPQKRAVSWNVPARVEPELLHVGLELSIDNVVKDNGVALGRQRVDLGVGILCEGLASCERSAFNAFDPDLISRAQETRFKPYGGAAAAEELTVHCAGGAW